MAAKKSLKKVGAPAEPAADNPPSKSRRPWYIAMLVVGLLLLGGSAALAYPGTMTGWEQRVFAAVNNIAPPAWVAGQLAKPLSNAVWGMVGLVLILLAVPKFRLRAWQYAVAGGSGYAVAFVLEHIVGRGRPQALPYHVVLRASQSGYGFPSEHIAVVTGLGLTIWPYVAWPWRIFIIALIAAEAWSRVFLGVHAPLDVVGGFAVGMVVVAIIHLTPAKIRRFFKLSA